MSCVKYIHNDASSCNTRWMSTAEISVTCVTNSLTLLLIFKCRECTKKCRILCPQRASQMRSMCYSLAQVLGTYIKINGIDGGEAEIIKSDFGRPVIRESSIRVQNNLSPRRKWRGSRAQLELLVSSSAFYLCMYLTDTLHPSPKNK